MNSMKEIMRGDRFLPDNSKQTPHIVVVKWFQMVEQTNPAEYSFINLGILIFNTCLILLFLYYTEV